MENKELAKYVDNQRWLMNSGLFSDSAKNMVFMYGSLAHKEVKAVELDIDVESKEVNYKIYLPKKVLKKFDKYQKLSKSDSFWGLWRFKRFLKKEGDMNFKNILAGFIKDFCGPKWEVNVEVFDVRDYQEEGHRDEEHSQDKAENS